MNTRRTWFSFGVALLAIGNLANAQPGSPASEEHKVLKKDVGEWDVEMKLWPQGPDGPVLNGEGQETGRVLGDNLWLISNFKASFSGVEIEGHGTFGYDAKKKKYIGTWVDNMTPTMSQMEGTYDAKTQTMTMFSMGENPMGKLTKTKHVAKYLDKDTRTFTMSYLAEEGKDNYIKMMEISYTRKKANK